MTLARDSPLAQATESDLTEVEAATRQLLDTRGGQSLEIVLSPAVKETRSRVSPKCFLNVNAFEDTLVSCRLYIWHDANPSTVMTPP
jgi:hypothetical protein